MFIVENSASEINNKIIFYKCNKKVTQSCSIIKSIQWLIWQNCFVNGIKYITKPIPLHD